MTALSHLARTLDLIYRVLDEPPSDEHVPYDCEKGNPCYERCRQWTIDTMADQAHDLKAEREVGGQP